MSKPNSPIECLFCGKMFKPNHSKRKFCSYACYRDWWTGTHKIGDTKVCKKCQVEKPRSEFYSSKVSHDGLISYCRECSRVFKRTPDHFRCIDCGTLLKHVPEEPEKDDRCIKCRIAKRIKNSGGIPFDYGGAKNFVKSVYSCWSLSAKRRGLIWELTKQQVEEKYYEQNGLCALSGIVMNPNTNSPYTPSIDRIDSQKGYIKGNFQFLCSMVNMMKNKFNEKEFLEMCRRIAEYKI